MFEEGKRRGGYSRRHSQEGDEIGWMVDIPPDPRLADDQRVDPTASRRIEMWVEAVFAETKRNDIRRRTEDHVRPELVMRRHDGEGRRDPVRRKRRSNLG